jgi:molybdopterin-guanine dinucleotide biosynthesis protein A
LKVNCIILAGGKSSRLARNKIFEIVGSNSLLERVVSSASQTSSKIIIVTAKGQTIPKLADNLNLSVVTDIYSSMGPLGGIHAGLLASDSFYNLIVASDMPFLNPALLGYMTRVAMKCDCDLVVAKRGKTTESLPAVYTKRCLALIEPMIKRGKLSLHSLLYVVRVKYIEAKEVDRIDPKHLSFFNINTESDLKNAKEIEKERTDQE